MTLFSRMRQKLSLRGMFLLCAAAFVAKDVLFLLARTPTLLYVSAALQFFEFGVFLPATVYYAAETLDAANQAKGQGLIHIFSNGVGPAVMRYAGGSGGRERHAAVQRGCRRGGTAGGGLCYVRVF